MVEYDSPWKESLDAYLEGFLALCFPVLHREIAWDRGSLALDKELQKIVREAETGRRIVDKLYRVWRNNGEEQTIFIHIEVQIQPLADFAQRMFVYHYRLLDLYNQKKVVSLAVLGDDQVDRRPDAYRREYCGCRIDF